MDPRRRRYGRSEARPIAGDTLGPAQQHNNCSSDLWRCDAVVDARELLGLSPWFFGAVPFDADATYEASWAHLDAFRGTFGLRTAAKDVEGECPSASDNYTDMSLCGCYNYSHSECAWNAPSWPYETSRTLTAMADLLQGEIEGTYAPEQAAAVDAADFAALVGQYARQHTTGIVSNYSDASPYVGESQRGKHESRRRRDHGVDRPWSEQFAAWIVDRTGRAIQVV